MNVKAEEAEIEVELVAVLPDECGRGEQADYKVDSAFFVFVPGLFGSIVKIARKHCKEYHYVIKYVLNTDFNADKRNEYKHADKNYTCATLFTCGKLAVKGKITSAVNGKLVFEEFERRKNTA